MPSLYTKAAISDPQLKQAYALCRRIVRATQPHEYALSQLMTPVLRPALWALWGALRVADDLADSPDAPNEREAALDEWTAALEADLKTGTSRDPLRRALVHTVGTWNIPREEMYSFLRTLRQDPSTHQPPTWEQWSSHRQSHASFAAKSSLMLAGAFNVTVRMRHMGAYRRWLIAWLLVDSLEDLADDLNRGHLDWPTEGFEDAGAEPADLLNRRWTPGVEALIQQVTAKAQEWLAPMDTTDLPPGLAVVFDTSTALYRARLQSVRTAGPALLHKAPHLSRAVRWRILAPARAKAAVAWQFTAVKAPKVQASPLPEPAHAATVPHDRTDCAPQPLLPPPPHPRGARPPALPAERMPCHVAVIMDGNGRWATRRGLQRSEGHRVGANAMRDVIYGAAEIGLSHLSLFLFSTENWKRNYQEIAFLFETLRNELRGEQATFDSLGIRVRWAGRTEGLPEDLLEKLLQAVTSTQHQPGLTVTFCFNYGGRAELTQAAAQLMRAAASGDLQPDHVTEQDLANHMLLPDTPDVDLLWRTGGERRISNFLLWQSAYAELHFTDTCWPDVDRRDLWQAITAYAHRDRRYGTVPATAPAPCPDGPTKRAANSDCTAAVVRDS